MVSEFWESMAAYRTAIRMLSEHKLWKYVIIPGLISIAITIGLIFVALGLAESLGAWLSSFSWSEGLLTAFKSWTEKYAWLSFLGNKAATILSVLFVTGIVIFLFKYIVMVIIAPFMGMLSEKVESILTGKPAPSVTPAQFIQDIIRGLRIALRNIVRELFYTLVFLLFNLAPVIGNLLSTVSIFLVQAYYAGFGNMDYTLERKRFSVRNSVRFVRIHRGLAAGNGVIFLLIFLIPVLGWFLAPAYGTIAATLTSLKRLEE